MPVRVKVCGVTTVEDAVGCMEAGVDAIGINLVPESPRCVDRTTARSLSDAIARHARPVLSVGVTADLDLSTLRALRDELGLGCLQLHGEEPAEVLEGLLPHAYKAVRVATEDDVARAERYPGEYLLVDAKIDGALGGTGVLVDPALVAPLATRRRLTLAGGLTPDNVGQAIRAVRPWAVDVASGVERPGAPGKKDLGRVAAFVAAVRAASG